jgi:hypothetical protein
MICRLLPSSCSVCLLSLHNTVTMTEPSERQLGSLPATGDDTPPPAQPPQGAPGHEAQLYEGTIKAPQVLKFLALGNGICRNRGGHISKTAHD